MDVPRSSNLKGTCNSKCRILDTLGYRSSEPVTIICTCVYCFFTYVVYIVVAIMLEEVLKFHIGIYVHIFKE